MCCAGTEGGVSECVVQELKEVCQSVLCRN